MSSYIKV